LRPAPRAQPRRVAASRTRRANQAASASAIAKASVKAALCNHRQRGEGECDAVEEEQDEQAHERGHVGVPSRMDDDACGREERDHPKHLHEALRSQRVEGGRRQEREQQGEGVRAFEQPRRP